MQIILFFVFLYTVFWRVSTDRKDAPISFKHFKSFYNLAPNRFEFLGGNQIGVNWMKFRFSIWEWWKFLFFRIGVKKKKIRKANAQKIELLLKVMQEEIEKTKIQSRQEFAKSVSMMEDATKGVKSNERINSRSNSFQEFRFPS